MASTAANREDGGNQDQVMEGYLQRILRARVYEVARETPLEPATRLSQRLGHSVLLKREDLQPVFSLLLRGAFNKMVQLPAEQLQRGVIAASAGNHAQGVALAAERLGCSAVIVMPVTTPRTKVEAVRSRGAEVVLHGDSFDAAQAHARTWSKSEGCVSSIPLMTQKSSLGREPLAWKSCANAAHHRRPFTWPLAAGA